MPAGRPTDLTPEVIEDVRRLLPISLYLETVGNYIGVSRMTIHRWSKRGRQEEKRLRNPRAKPKPSEAIYLQFCYAYKKGLAEGELYDAGVVKQAAATQWQAAAWRLERRFPERWGRDRALLLELVKQVKGMQPADRRSDSTNRREPL
jgi:transposase